MNRPVFLIGLSGAGKSTAGRIAAGLLGWDFVDSDTVLEERAGRSIPELFRDEGEAAFRAREQAVLEDLARRTKLIVATGGGAPTTSGSRDALDRGLVIWLDVMPEGAARRLAANPATETRPLLEGDPLDRLHALYEARHHWYERSDRSIAVDYYNPQQVGEQITSIVRDAADWTPDPHRFDTAETMSNDNAESYRIPVTTPGASYIVTVEDGALSRIGAICRAAGLSGRAFVLSDDAVGPIFVPQAVSALEAAAYEAASYLVPNGEAHKNIDTVIGIYDWLLDIPLERGDFLVCLGGGVVTDVGGFAAATVLRGIPFVHVPTTLLGMVDASIGGKTGIDHARGKNLIGAFAQPAAVIADPQVLRTLPERDLRSGWGELVKHGFILDEPMVTLLEDDPDAGGVPSAELIARNVAIKAGVVSADEREADRRTLLNYGHTIGHAIEAVTAYSRYTHGEAVAIGMRAAGLISVEMGLLPRESFERQQRLIRSCGLPDTAPGLSLDDVLAAAQSDKKVQAGAIRWVLLDGLGNAVVRKDVPPEVARRAVEAVLS
ncbi:hypothetical protein AYO38_06910 [bacterium SCGC AG-212-C10]|nr:hypothetical protein AYO38_06910 [bacterium SCGC AG-212-C10]